VIRRRFCSCAAILLASAMTIACGSTLGPASSSQAPRDSATLLPQSYQDCRAAGGELEPQDRGGRCFAYYTKGRGISAYSECRSTGGMPHVVGPGRSVSGQSHVCTLVFQPGEYVEES
jgi:hypothetical protein